MANYIWNLLKTIDDPERRQRALLNFRRHIKTHPTIASESHRTLREALSLAFIWRNTAQGDRYWRDYHTQLPEH